MFLKKNDQNYNYCWWPSCSFLQHRILAVGMCRGVTPLERVDPSHSLTDTASWRPNKVARAPDNMLTGDSWEGGKEQRENQSAS